MNTQCTGSPTGVVQHIIDLDKDPLIPTSDFTTVTVERHLRGGQFLWDPTKVSILPIKNSLKYKNDLPIEIYIRECVDDSFFNANLFDYLLQNPEIIPEDWKLNSCGQPSLLPFWGTIYLYKNFGRCIRSFYFLNGLWHPELYWVHGNTPPDAAVVRRVG